MFQKFNTFTKLKSCVIVGKQNYDMQERQIKNYPHLIIATPGRLVDLLNNNKNLTFDDLSILVLDEAD